ncbi:DUF7289 family protein [Halopenitus persicus]|uniref:Type IV pilin n=1 Tax=Halopenitus persicus TaxID=1048396 RepID=A0A1H3IFS9_9EURY|nr:hypothetical protein [Halopenitus persicus]SDY26492.1 hypothetical protein SAMN05216564_104108 [Halopenitus persicus]
MSPDVRDPVTSRAKRTADTSRSNDRAQSTVVGVTLLIAITVTSLGLITAGAGVVVEEHARTIGMEATTADLTDAIDATDRGGRTTASVRLAGGRLDTIDRTVRVHDGSGWRSLEANGIRYVPNSGDQRVVSVAGIVVREYGDGAIAVRDPAVLVGEEAFVVTIPVIRGGGAVGANGWTAGGTDGRAVDGTDDGVVGGPTGASGGTARLRMAIDHADRSLGTGPFRIAIETSTPAAVERAVRRISDRAAASDPEADPSMSVERRRFAGDDHESVVVTVGGDREGHLLVRTVDLELEVTNGA